MKKIINNIFICISFIAGLLVLVSITSTILMPKDISKDKGIQDPIANGIVNESKNSIDVLILGDSETYSSIIPLQMWRDYGITSYCCGTPGQTLCYSVEFLYKAFENQSPKVVILETNTIYKDVPIEDALAKKVDRFLPLFNYHNRWKALFSKGSSFVANYTYFDNTKGYLYSTAVSPASTDDYMTPSDEYDKIPPRSRNYVEKIKAYCDKKGAKLILVSTPSTKNWNSKRHNSIQKFTDTAKITYVDMNMMTDIIPVDWQTETRDKGDHLNHKGAMKVTSYLGKFLSENEMLKDHRDDESFHSWNTALNDFNKATSNSLVTE